MVDGAYGFAGTDLPHGDDTLYIGIDPHAEVTRFLEYEQMMLPVVGDEFEHMVRAGYEEMMAWDGHYNRKVHLRQPNYQVPKAVCMNLLTLERLKCLSTSR